MCLSFEILHLAVEPFYIVNSAFCMQLEEKK